MFTDDMKVYKSNEKELVNLIQTIKIYSQYIGMEFGIEKGAILIMKSRKSETTEGIELQNQERIKRFGKKENSKYLGILKVDVIKQEEMKESEMSITEE